MNWVWGVDGWIVLAGVLCAMSAALLGNFLLLRRLSMLGDAISHAVLPGLAIAFMISGSRNSAAMFVGAILTGVLTAMFTQWIRDTGKVDEGASMGVVFTTLFSLGLVLIVRGANHVDLDINCVLLGSLETVHLQTVNLLQWQIPTSIVRMSIVFLVNAIFVWLLFKELRISAFDPSLSTTMGFSSTLMHYLLMTLVALTAVASFESVGNILVVAMFVVPPAAASLITGRLSAMIWWSLLVAFLSGVSGHLMAIQVPAWFGQPGTNTSGMIAVASGLFFVAAWMFGPRQGLVLRWLTRQWLAQRILREDILALLYRWRERNARTNEAGMQVERIRELLLSPGWSTSLAIWQLRRRGMLTQFAGGKVELTSGGLNEASALVRSHRLWESYLASELELDIDRLHIQAERLEHFTGQQMRQRLEEQTRSPDADPHGSPIPPEPEK